jgi:Ca2+-binding EF-hand superfamily protein
MILAMAHGDDWKKLIENLFGALDRDGSGEVDVLELSTGIQNLAKQQGRSKITPEQLKVFYDDLDADFSGKISLKEFMLAAEFYRPSKGPEVEAWNLLLQKVNDDPMQWEKSVEKLFKEIDTDGSGDADVVEVGYYSVQYLEFF